MIGARLHSTVVQRHDVARRLVAVVALAGTLASIGLIAAGPASAAGPTVTINQGAGQSDPTAVAPVVFTAIFSAPVTGFTAADVSLSSSTTGGTLAAVVTGSSTTYTVSVSGMTTAGNVIAAIPAGAAQDGSSNSSLASTSTDNTVTWAPDTTPPAVTIDQAAGQADPSSASPVQFTATFSEPVTGFTAADVSLSSSTTGGTLAAVVTGGPSVYTVSVSGMAHTGNVIASIPAGAAIDAAGNPSTASTSTDHTVTWADTTPPAVTIDQAASQADPSSASSVQFTATFSAPVTGFTAADVSLSSSTTGGTLAAVVTGSSTTYTVSVSGMTTAGNVIAAIPAGAAQDGSSNPSLASTSSDHTVAWFPDTIPPAVTIDQAPGQADPTAVSPIQFTATFSEPVTGFTAADVLLSSSTAGGALATSVSGGPTVYAVGVSGMTGAGNVVASIRAGAAIDEATNPSLASSSTDNSVAWLPTVRQLLTASDGGAAKASLTLLSKCRPQRPCVTAKGGASLPLKVSCQGTVSCAGTIAITAKGTKSQAARTSKRKTSMLGKLQFTVAAGAEKLLRVPLTAAARSLLAADPHLKASVAIALGSTKTKHTITFALPKPKRAPKRAG